jgi:hypothetical protein
MISRCVTGCVLGALLLAVAAPVAFADIMPVSLSLAAPRGLPATMTSCDNLLRQFDVAWPTHQHALHAARARKNREVGAVQCREGHYADGVRALRRALHDIGVKPVRVVSLPASGGAH